jgi:hypothetical protein
MNRPVKKLIFWTPRVLCIAFALFINMLALDVFNIKGASDEERGASPDTRYSQLAPRN